MKFRHYYFLVSPVSDRQSFNRGLTGGELENIMSRESPIVKNEVQQRKSIGKSVSNSSGPYQLTLLSGKNIQHIDRQ